MRKGRIQDLLCGGNTSTKRIPQPSRTWEWISLDMGWHNIRTGVVFSLCKEGPCPSLHVAHLSAPGKVTDPVALHRVLWTGWQNTVAARQTSLDECSWSPLPGSVCKFLTQILLSQAAFPGQEGKKESVTESEKQKESAWVYSGLSGSRRGVGLEGAL